MTGLTSQGALAQVVAFPQAPDLIAEPPGQPALGILEGLHVLPSQVDVCRRTSTDLDIQRDQSISSVHEGVKPQPRGGGAGVEGPRPDHFIPTSSRDAIAATGSAWVIDAAL